MFFNPSVKDAVKNFQEAQKFAGEVLQSLTPGSGVYDLFAAISKGEPPKGSSWGFLILGALGDIPGLTELKGLKIVKAFEKGAEVAGDVGKAGKAAGKGLSTAEQLAQRGVTGFTNHGAKRAAVERGFTDERVLKVISEGQSVVAKGRYGTDQIRYTLGQNTVVVETGGRNAGKVITTFSPAEGGVWVAP